MLGVTTCWNCGSSNLKPVKPDWKDPYKREHYQCRNCGADVRISTLTIHDSGYPDIRWVTGNDGTVIVAACSSGKHWVNRVYKSMIPVERALVASRLEDPEAEKERAGRVVIKKGYVQW